MGGRTKFTYDFVRSTFYARGCTLVETEYSNDRTPLRYVAQCGHERTSTFNNFRRGKGDLCVNCRRAENGRKESLGEDTIRSAFESAGCKVLNNGFYRQTDPVRYIALCGHENVSDYAHFTSQNSGRLCRSCSKSVRYEYDYVREQFDLRDCVLLEREYVNCKTKLRYIAQCGHESEITFDALLNSGGAALRCRDCHKHTYHDVPVDRNRTASKVWRKEVYARDGFRCVACGKRGGDLNAHHLYAYDDNPELRFEVSNGVTLCPNCHTKFHCRYGFGGNTAEQFQEWLEGNTEVSVGDNTPTTP